MVYFCGKLLHSYHSSMRDILPLLSCLAIHRIVEKVSGLMDCYSCSIPMRMCIKDWNCFCLFQALPFERALARSPSLNLDILTASPKANGFYGAKGLSGFVPTAYSLVMARVWQKLCNTSWSGRRNSAERQVLEYCRDNWQFHAKGIW